MNKMAKSSSGPKNKDLSIELAEAIKFAEKNILTHKERLVFYGLIKFPELNDSKLSGKFKIKRSTITAIRNKLRRKNFYSTYIIPNFKLLGYELMTFIWGKSSPPILRKEKMEINPIKEAMNSPNSVFQVATDNEFFALLVFKNFTEFKKMQDSYASVYKKYSGDEHNINIIHFPLETSKAYALFDYSLALKELLRLKLEEKETKPNEIKAKQLRKVEELVMGSLIKHPTLNDKEIAKKINITRQTVSKIRSRLIKQGAIKLVNEPNFKKIGCELFVAIYNTFNPLIDPDKRRSLVQKWQEECPMVLDMQSKGEQVCAGIFENYLSFKLKQDSLLNVYAKNGLLSKNPIIHIISIPQIKFQKTDFVSATENAMNAKIP